MRIERLAIRNFRGIQEMDLDFHPKLNVFVGANGAGKSSVLDCIGAVISHVRPLTSKRHDFDDRDIQNGKTFAAGKLRLSLLGKTCTYSLECSFDDVGCDVVGEQSRQVSDDLHELRNAVVHGDRESPFPLIVYYPTKRAILDIPEESRAFQLVANQTDALEGAMENRLDFRYFYSTFSWCEKVIAHFSASIKDADALPPDIKWAMKQVDAVRSAVKGVVPGFEGLRRAESSQKMVVAKASGEFAIEQLSDGEQCLLAMVGDLAQRLAIANPALDNPLEGEAVVMIDEIELHLHPGWQRQVISGLLDTFPKCQFIITTHSPQVLGEVRSENIHLLSSTDDGIVAHRFSEEAYGMTSDLILESLMGTSERTIHVEEKLRELFSAIERRELNRARQLVAELQKMSGSIPELTRADMLIRRKELIGK